MPSTIAVVLGSAGAVYMFLAALLHLTQDPKEPPMLKTSIPFIGPVLGSLKGMPKFMVEMRDKYNLPIYTLRMPGSRIYVVNSTSLVPQVQKQYKTIAFQPMAAMAAANVMNVGKAGNAIIGSDRMFEDDSYLATFVPFIAPAMSPGPGLDTMTAEATRIAADSIDKISRKGPVNVELFEWVRHQVFEAETAAMYGEGNPLRDPALEAAWYDFEPGIVFHMIKAWPSVLARKSLHARDKLLIPAFEKYYDDEHHLKASLLVQCQYNHNIHHGLRGRDVAATEIGHMVAFLTNTMASAYWMVYYIFSDPVVLGEVRQELYEMAHVDENGVSTIDMAKIKTSAPILNSTWQEMLRYVHIGISARLVMEDVMLDNKYLLKKGSTVMTAAPIQHTDPALWGSTVGNFDHRRFLRQPGQKRANAASLRAFGGGHVLCPGRHFSSAFIMTFAALMVLRFDIECLSKDGTWSEPRKFLPMTTSIPTPKDNLKVRLIPRDDRKWKIGFSISSKEPNTTVEGNTTKP
ncbi:cytochrome P450 [Stachybotrys elegans]|uniref:Cytochrome P450 n=1 Tax=Stachybotrys elegans TaxID=80388 RepID=A0A8K0T1K8_9HYPO|nr:cytochrome P450 [Stachybotrys elegans]